VARAGLLAAGAAVAYSVPAGIGYTRFGPVIGVHRLLAANDRLALTFDDGPQPGATDRVVDVLGRLGVRATFFMVGEQVERYPDLAREVAAAGHELANHGYRHRNHMQRNPFGLMEDVRRGAAALADATGQRPDLFRAPQGVVTLATLLAARREGAAVVHWSAWGRDWRPAATNESITRDALRGAGGGGILLLHDADYYRGPSWRVTFEAVPRIVEELRLRGLALGPIGGRSALRRD
jgi:peptidoglycan/xylan/chitin deacetylase (PgdA/CDA1 family)